MPHPKEESNAAPAGSGLLGASFLAALLGLGIWLALVDALGTETWGYGPATFWRLLGLVAVLLAASFLSPSLRWGVLSKPMALLCGAATLGLAVYQMNALGVELERPANRDYLVDIGANTYRAGSSLLEGDNPYASPNQVWHRVLPGPGVRVEEGQVWMYGLPYDYGFPYFPGLLLSYLPFRALADGYDSIRVANGILLMLNLLGIGLLALRLRPGVRGYAAAGLGGVAYLGVAVLGHELFHYGITDLVIATYALYGFVALAYGRFALAGVLLGLAQACKLLPGPALVLPVLLYLGATREARRVALAYVATAGLVVLPFVFWDPERFATSTVLYYLTHHRGGDNTSLWFFLSPAWQTPLLVLGGVLAVACLALARWRHALGLAWPLALAFCSYVIFVAFNKMSHLNYTWGVYALGCAALGLMLSGTPPARARERARRALR